MSNSPSISVKSAAIATATALGVVAAAWLLWRTATAVLLVSISLLIAVALNHIVAWIEGRGLSRGLAVAIAMIALVGTLAGVAALIIPPLVAQLKLFIAAWPQLLSSFQRSAVYSWLERHFDVQAILDQVRARAPSLVGEALSVVKVIVEGVGGMVTVLFIVTFMLVAGRQLVWAALAQARPASRRTWAALAMEVYHALGGYVLGLIGIIFIQMVATSIWLAIVGVPYFLPLGILSGLASLIPFAGAIIMGSMVSLVAWGTQGLWSGVATAAYYLAYQQFEGHVLIPLVYRRVVRVNALAILLTVLFAFDLAGIPGAILAVPIAAAGQIVVRAILSSRRERLGIPTTRPGPEMLDTRPPAPPPPPGEHEEARPS